MSDCWVKQDGLWRINVGALATHLRKRGLAVVVVPGAQDRATTDNQKRSGWTTKPTTLIDHHTATAASVAGDYPSLRVVRDGRTGLKGPLSQIGLGRSGTVYLIASGLAWHAGRVVKAEYDNWHSVGIEAEDDGAGVFPKQQYKSYVRLNAALSEKDGLGLKTIVGHKEAAPGRKIDPVFSMSTMRADVKDLQSEWTTKAPTPPKTPIPPHPKPVTRVLRLGMTGKDIAAMQAGFNRVFKKTYDKLAEDGSFGYATAKVVKEFQTNAKREKRYSGDSDGIVGPKTRTALASYGVRFR